MQAEISRESDMPVSRRVHMACAKQPYGIHAVRSLSSSNFITIKTTSRKKNDDGSIGRLDVELCAPPVAAFCVVLASHPR